MIIASDITTLQDRGKYNGFIGSMVALGNGLGPLVGGILTEKASWRWTFWFIVPLVATVIVIITFALPPTQVARSARTNLRLVDWIGSLISISAVLLLLVSKFLR